MRTEIFARRWRNTSLEVTRVMLIYFPIHQKKEGGETVDGKLAPSPSKQSDLLKVRSGRDSFRADEDIRGLSREWEIKRDTGTFKKVPMLWGWWYDGRSAGMRAYGRRDLHYFESLLQKCGHIA